MSEPNTDNEPLDSKQKSSSSPAREAAQTAANTEQLSDERSAGVAPQGPNERDSHSMPTEVGGQKGPEPTRYGDWEKNGRCTDF